MKNIYIIGFLAILLLSAGLFNFFIGTPNADNIYISQGVSYILAIENSPASGNYYTTPRQNKNSKSVLAFQNIGVLSGFGNRNFASKKHFDNNYNRANAGASTTNSTYGQVSNYSIQSADKEIVISDHSGAIYSNNNTANNQTFNSVVSFQPGNRASNIRISNDPKVSNHGFYALSTDLSTVGLDQLIAEGGMQKLLDPNGDPEGEAIPVGDGWVFLMIMAIVYGFYKYKVKLSSPV